MKTLTMMRQPALPLTRNRKDDYLARTWRRLETLPAMQVMYNSSDLKSLVSPHDLAFSA